MSDPPMSDPVHFCVCRNDSILHSTCRISSENPCSECLQHAELETQIAETRSRLVQLVQRRGDQRRQMNRVHDKLALTLPVELFAKILLFSLVGSVRERMHAAFTVSHVSQSWRRVALSTPQLWTSFSIISESRFLDTGVELLAELLKRSQTFPLSLKLELEDNSPIVSLELADDIKPLADTLRKHAGRWEDLDICAPLHAIYALLWDIPGVKLHQLSISENSHVNAKDGAITTLDLCFRSSEYRPSASIVTLSGVRFENVPLDWESVTSFHGLHLSTGSYYQAICNCPRLERLKMETSAMTSHPWVEQIAPTTHSRLKSLEFVGGPDQSILINMRVPGFFSSLILPSLTELVFNSCLVTLDEIDGLLSRSSCSLSVLALDLWCSTDHPGNCMPWLAKLQTLDTLIISIFSSSVEQVLQNFAPPTNPVSSTQFLPHLTTLEIRFGKKVTNFPVKELLGILAYPRSLPQENAPSLSKLAIHYPPVREGDQLWELESETVHEVEVLRRCGFVVDIRVEVWTVIKADVSSGVQWPRIVARKDIDLIQRFQAKVTGDADEQQTHEQVLIQTESIQQ